jgi:pimeloyl-ACP methyl ester carboxylesterase
MSWTPAELGRIGAPMLLIFGDHDFITLEHAVEMSELISGAQLAVLPGATHMDVLRRPDLMIPLIQGFLG